VVPICVADHGDEDRHSDCTANRGCTELPFFIYVSEYRMRNPAPLK
jgi:hypothetical protein